MLERPILEASLAHALEVATAAAVEAGHMLREEFHRPGGARGSGQHAVIDELAEQVIRRRLLEAFPEWSYWGEETGTHGPEEGAPTWFVDPNDGTKPFLEGRRGSAVSIALVDQGVPVLGVCHSPLHPDDEGDLVTWAEGCGPVRRNGRPLPPREWASRLDASHVILISHTADTRVAANLSFASPARIRSMPSIAWRLALVACGEGEVATSLQGPKDYDFAGGLALIRGAGGVALGGSRDLSALRVGGRSPVLLAGGGAASRELAERDGSACVDPSSREVHPLFPLLRRKEGPRIPTAVLRRAQGCLLGQVAGDSLGGLVEFESARAIAGRYPDGPRRLADGGTFDLLAGQPTDDSEMALALARSMARRGTYDPEAAYAAYRSWLASHPFDVGTTTRSGLQRSDWSRPAGTAHSESNGSLMRSSPLALAAWSRRDGLEAWAALDSRLTHSSPVCVESCRAFLAALVVGLDGASREEMYDAALAHSDGSVRDALRAARHAAPQGQPHEGWVLIALQNAFFRLLHSDGFEQGVIDTVRIGGDTDTNAAIAGALLGAHHGREAVPLQWRQMVLTCRPHPAYAASRNPRPCEFWPADLYDLAERLLQGA